MFGIEVICVANLVADGQAVAASGICGAEAYAGFFLDHDSFRVAQAALFREYVTATSQRPLRVAGKAVGLARYFIRQPLMMNARRVDRLLDIHVVVDHVGDDAQDRVDDRWTTWTPDRKPKTAILPQHDRRRHC